METMKKQKDYTDYGLGFPVRILNAPFVQIQNNWVLDIDFDKYERVILFALATKECRLSGNEVRFIRHHFEMDLKNFGKRFGNVAHSAVIKWEKSGDSATKMNWSTEKDIRLAVINKIQPIFLGIMYEEFQEVPPAKIDKIKIDHKELMAA